MQFAARRIQNDAFCLGSPEIDPDSHGATRGVAAEQFRGLRSRVAAGDFGKGGMVMDGLEVLG